MTDWAVFLDRDGVLTDAPVIDGQALAPVLAADLVVLPGVCEAVTQLRAMGARTFVVTNQPDVARGLLDPVELAMMHEHLARVLSVDEIRVCPHDGADDCACRKPRPGMLIDLARTWDIDLSRSWMIGDRWVDIAAGAAAGLRTILVDRDYSWSATSSGSPPDLLAPDHRVDDLPAAARLIERYSGLRPTGKADTP